MRCAYDMVQLSLQLSFDDVCRPHHAAVPPKLGAQWLPAASADCSAPRLHRHSLRQLVAVRLSGAGSGAWLTLPHHLFGVQVCNTPSGHQGPAVQGQARRQLLGQCSACSCSLACAQQVSMPFLTAGTATLGVLTTDDYPSLPPCVGGGSRRASLVCLALSGCVCVWQQRACYPVYHFAPTMFCVWIGRPEAALVQQSSGTLIRALIPWSCMLYGGAVRSDE
mmetsp:Transcript_2983/g.7349  ORF Transcript_2983/g.7349 Transcript_2983/m.7349 type:complete len:222 (-) Transcript_2983:2144-2809(-)